MGVHDVCQGTEHSNTRNMIWVIWSQPLQDANVNYFNTKKKPK